MHKLERLAIEMQSKPNTIKEIELEVAKLVQEESCALLFELQYSKVLAVHIFLCKVLEMRIKNKANTLALSEEIQICTQLLLKRPSFQVCEVYSLLGLYCWPAKMPEFIDTISSILNVQTGYETLLAFLENVNTNTTIDEKRRTELKRAMSLVYEHIESKFSEQFASFIIPIYTELLKILPKTFDFSLVFKKAATYPDEAISFILDGFPFIDQNRILQILGSLPVDPALIQSFTTVKFQRLEDPNKLYEYVFRALSDDHVCFIPAIDFWQKVFSSKTHAVLLEPVLTEILKGYLSTPDETKEDVDQHIFGLFSILCKNYTYNIAEFLKVNGEHLPVRITANFIQKLSKSEDPSIINTLMFNNPYLNCFTHFLRGDQAAQEMIFNLDFNDKESVKLCATILDKYTFSHQKLMYLLNMCENACLNANEIKVMCFIKLGMHETFGANWSTNDVIKYFYYLKKLPEEYVTYKDYFYSLFIRNAPFDRCFSIVEKLGKVPDAILHNIYEKMDKYVYVDLCCFNNDLLLYLEDPKPYMEREVSRFVLEWNKITDHVDYYQALKSLITVFSAKIDTYPIIDSLVDLFQIDSSIILCKIFPIFNAYKGNYNVGKAVYYLISLYNLPSATNLHALISTSLTLCLSREEGPMAFHRILGVDINRCCEVREQVLKVNKKTAQNMVRDLIKDFKGKPFNKMFESYNKVTKQDFLPQKEKESNDYTLKDVNFL
ncbi:hypothetical protein GINT2_000536 [Glugoides intestinalis]